MIEDHPDITKDRYIADEYPELKARAREIYGVINAPKFSQVLVDPNWDTSNDSYVQAWNELLIENESYGFQETEGELEIW